MTVPTRPRSRVLPALLLVGLLGVAGAAATAGPSHGAEGDPVAVAGTVLDPGGEPAPGALISAEPQPGVTISVYADDAGRFRLPPEVADGTLIRIRLPGVGSLDGVAAGPGPHRLQAGDPLPPTGARWLAALPDDETTRRFILDCTGCHVTDASRIRPGGTPRDSAGWHAAVVTMNGMFGPGTGFPIISSWAAPDTLAGWAARHFGEAEPRPAPPAPGGDAVLTEYAVPVPADLPHDLMVDDRGTVLVTGMFTHQMYLLDPGTGEWRTETIPVAGANPRALDLDDRGRWWVVLGGPGRVAVHDPASGDWDEIDVGMYAHSIMVGPDGRGWVNGHFTAEPELVAAVDLDAGTVETFEVPPEEGIAYAESTIPYGLRVADDGTVWGTQLRGNRILRLDPGTGAVDQWSVPVSHAGPRRPDLDAEGHLWIPLYSANALARFDPATEEFRVWPFPVEGALPYVARVDRARGTVWIGTGHGDVVAAFDPATEDFTLYPLPTRGALIRHLDIDEARGEVWFAYGASPGIPGRVLRLTPR